MSLKKLNSSRTSEESCEKHTFCPHQHFKKCRRERERMIPYTYRPIKEIDLTCNVHPKCLGQLGIGNVPTIAYERFVENPILPEQ